MRLALAVLLLVGCSSDYGGVVSAPPSKFGSLGPDAAPERFCGVVPGAECTAEGQELARCLCGSFEEQIGRVVCCREGRASVQACAKDSEALGCDGKPLIPSSDSGAD